MTDDEYIEFLQAVADEYVRLDKVPHRRRHPMEREEAVHTLERLQASGRTMRIVEEHCNSIDVYPLAQQATNESWQIDRVKDMLEEAGILDAIDEHGDILFGNLRRSALPDADAEILRAAGHDHPEAALRIAVVHARERWTKQRDRRAGSVMKDAVRMIDQSHKALKDLDKARRRQIVLEETVEDYKERNELIEKEGGPPQPKPKKWFGGIARIFAGTASAAGNVLLGTGLVTTGGGAPVGTAAVLASCTASIVLIGDGIDTLRGAS